MNSFNLLYRSHRFVLFVLFIIVFPSFSNAADVITNGNFSSGTTGWTHVDITGATTVSADATYGNPSPSLKNLTGIGKKTPFVWYDYQNISTPINSTDTVFLSLWWQKISFVSIAQDWTNIEVRIVKPSSAEATIWTETSAPAAPGTPLTGTVSQFNASSFFDEDGLYEIRLYADVQTGNNNDGQIQINWDNVVLDVRVPVANDPPVVTDIPDQSILEGQTFTTINLDDYVSDADNTDAEMTWTYSGNTELTVDITSCVATITIPDINWNGAEVITFRATDPGLLWDEDPATFTVTAQNDPPIVTDIPDQSILEGQTFTTINLDDYISDVDNTDAQMTWTYSGNTELIVDITNRVATITTPSPTWQGAEIITFRATDPGLLWDEDPATFTVTPQNDPPVVTDIPNQTILEGATFTAITLDDYVSDPDNTDAEMTWTYSGNTELTVDITSRIATITIPDINWNGAETITFRATDPGLLWDEDPAIFTVTAQNDPPTFTPGATAVSPASVNRVGTNSTTISTVFSDVEQPGINAFTVTYKVKDISETETILVNALTNGNGGLTITDGGGGSYTASYTWDPGPAQATGTYDLYFEVSDGSDNAIDTYVSNSDELTIVDIPVNNAPTVVSGATQVSPASVERLGANTTVISTDFNDIDQPGIGAFNVTFKIREPNDATQLTLVDNQPDGLGGLAIVDNGGGSYTASFTYNPDDGQTLGLYDLYFEVSDGTDNAIDNYVDNLNELAITGNNAPTVIADATTVSPSSVDRTGANTTIISTDFNDIDQPVIGAFNVTFKIREPDNFTELILVNNQPDGGGGLTITDNGSGSYTASFTYNPDDAQNIGVYDLYFEVTDGTDNVVDGFTINADELNITGVAPNNPPAMAAGNTSTTFSQVNRIGSSNTTILATFTDVDDPGINAFTVTFKLRAPNDVDEVILVNAQTHGNGGLTITDNGLSSYTARYVYNPDDAQTLGNYDLYFEVSDGTDNLIDGFANNLNELEVVEIIANNVPVITAGITTAIPGSIDRAGAITTNLSADFSDVDEPGISGFYITFKVRLPNSSTTLTIADNLQNGQSGMTVTDNGGGSYTADIDWDPLDNAVLGYYDLYCMVYDGVDAAIDDVDNNPNELLLTNGGENAPPNVPGDATFALPAGIERIGANSTTISATFSDGDSPGIGAFTVNFKLREPDNIAEIILATNAGNNQQGVSIVDAGGGVYTASVNWDPPDAQQLGFYDLYFDVTDGNAFSYDNYENNSDEMEIYDAISNIAPTITVGNTTVQPDSISRNGTEYTVISCQFVDADMPGSGAFQITIKARDQGATEYTIVNAAYDSQQDLKIRRVSGSTYEASVKWDPPAGQTTGTYDLYMYVEDNHAAAATDDYVNNPDELIISSEVLAGDGNLLRRSHTAAGCGGATSGCHNMADHQGQDCLVCHTPHSTDNIFLVRDSIQTPNSGLRDVDFYTVGFGDAYNPEPDSGVADGDMADDLDGVHTGVCEVCHTTTTHHNNTDTHTLQGHNNTSQCHSCHPHADGFANTGGGESSGGMACTCHASIYSPMNSSTTSYHHQMNSDAADYTISSRTCLTCHVDHDIFSPDFNAGFGVRSENLRIDITTPVVQGSNSVMLNSDYQSSGAGGICLSCHTSTQAKGYTQPDGTTQTPALSKSDYDGATSAHNYSAPSTFTDGSTFNANCVKCHNDNMGKAYQSSTNKFGTHNSDYRRILEPFGTASPSDPLEEKFCFQCHSTTSNPNAGSNLDNYGVKAMSASSLGIESAFGKTYTHPTTTVSGLHKPGEGASDYADGNRHAECGDCHDPHAAQQGTHDGSSSLASNALKGTWGVEPTWPTPAVPTDNANVYTAPSAYSVVTGVTLKEYQICLKCHSNYTTLPGGVRNLAEEINPNYPSTHGITIANQNTFCNTSTMNEPWASSGLTYCSDCHRSDTPTDPEGPHGSNQEHLLVATIVSNISVGTPLCYTCHLETVYWSDRNSANVSKMPDHPSAQGAHALAPGCFSCHMWDHAATGGLGEPTADWSGPGAATLHVHGQNKKWVYNTEDGSAGTGQPADNFINGYISNLNHSGNSCWAETCKNHSNKSY